MCSIVISNAYCVIHSKMTECKCKKVSLVSIISFIISLTEFSLVKIQDSCVGVDVAKHRIYLFPFLMGLKLTLISLTLRQLTEMLGECGLGREVELISYAVFSGHLIPGIFLASLSLKVSSFCGI